METIFQKSSTSSASASTTWTVFPGTAKRTVRVMKITGFGAASGGIGPSSSSNSPRAWTSIRAGLSGRSDGSPSGQVESWSTPTSSTPRSWGRHSRGCRIWYNRPVGPLLKSHNPLSKMAQQPDIHQRCSPAVSAMKPPGLDRDPSAQAAWDLARAMGIGPALLIGFSQVRCSQQGVVGRDLLVMEPKGWRPAS